MNFYLIIFINRLMGNRSKILFLVFNIRRLLKETIRLRLIELVMLEIITSSW